MYPTSLLSILFSLFLLHQRAHAECEPVTCGELPIKYPFWLGAPSDPSNASCGHPAFELRCADNSASASLRGSGIRVHDIDYDTSSFLVSHDRLTHGTDAVCCIDFNMSTILPLAPFDISPNNRALCFLYGCNGTEPGEGDYVNATGVPSCDWPISVYLGGSYDRDMPPVIPTGNCMYTYHPVLGSEAAISTAANYSRLLKSGFVLDWTGIGVGDCSACSASGGQCRYNNESAAFACLCPVGKLYELTCADWEVTSAFISGLTSAAATLLFTCLYVLICHSKGKRHRFLCKKTSSNTEKSYEAMIASHGSLAPERYKYSEVIKITSSRENQLGEGGYGVVFKGRLSNGCLVAVKFLHDCKESGDEFVNEVMSIGRTSHINVVSLFGFSLEGSKRALIYEFMPNSSLDKYIYSENPKEILGWERLYVIAIGIARGLEYLHHSCNTRIVHFDIKPQNILLDKDFSPKIADFGLAKLCHTKESKLSMTGARGTIGFIAPEVYSRTFGVVSIKSDVYSYGMMLLEMVGGRKNVKSTVTKSSEQYFPDWIYDHFEKEDGLQACEVTSGVEDIAKKMTLIGLWCIQVLPMHRPSITNVLEMFERSLDALDMPPKQNFSELLESSAHNMNVESASSTGSDEIGLVKSKISKFSS
ncbi:LEAF RUST 10 DISEASE-RESISTANCE LOCUS RECEPTOR-LIKE PROTEIN KINASE-like 2.1 [Hordeum vulgare subsp. vulgare]|nr:LEAF RUST 10 DISEASE-RESISTANCE LOCUS RECEPTOR-LIKE PROTEIN KINASE-like 2.1 [Hordeum vulgare subsp. vulgare]